MRSLLKIFTILPRQQLVHCGGLLLVMIIGAALETVGIGAILPLISIMGQPDFLANHGRIADIVARFGVHTHNQMIMLCAVGLIFVYILKNIYLAWQSQLQIRFVVNNQMYFARQLFAEYMAKPYSYYLNHNLSEATRNISSPTVIFSSILMPTLMLMTEIVTGSTIVGLLILADPLIAILVAGLMACVVCGLFKAFRNIISERGSISNQYQTLMRRWVTQGLQSIKDSKVLQREQFFCDAYESAYQNYNTANQKYLFIQQLPRLFVESIVVAGLLFLVIIKLLGGSNPQEIVPVLGVLAMAAFRLMPSANRIIGYLNTIKYNMLYFHQVYPELLEIRRLAERGTADSFFPPETNRMPFAKKICIEHLAFRYSGGTQNVLSDVSFVIPKGSFVGIIGPSGAGKTTFVEILLGILPPNAGKIMTDGISIYDNIRAWQANLAYVPQSIYLIDASIRENVAFGHPENEIDDERVAHVLQMAELQDFVQSLPNGVHTSVGDRGVRLSGGQRQRIGIARALYCNPEVLVLDEATSALDNETEKSITDTILKLKGKITIIAIAHRISTLEACDFKVKFENGRASVVQEG